MYINILQYFYIIFHTLKDTSTLRLLLNLEIYLKRIKIFVFITILLHAIDLDLKIYLNIACFIWKVSCTSRW